MLTTQCPKCKGTLVPRINKSDGNRFLGCSSYPRCKFAANYDEAVQSLAAEQQSRAPAAADIKRLLFDFHPDRAGQTVSTTTVTAALTNLLAKTRSNPTPKTGRQ